MLDELCNCIPFAGTIGVPWARSLMHTQQAPRYFQCTHVSYALVNLRGYQPPHGESLVPPIAASFFNFTGIVPSHSPSVYHFPPLADAIVLKYHPLQVAVPLRQLFALVRATAGCGGRLVCGGRFACSGSLLQLTKRAIEPMPGWPMPGCPFVGCVTCRGGLGKREL